MRLRQWCVRRILGGWSVPRIVETGRVPRRTVYHWWNRFQRKGWGGLVDLSRRPHTIHHLQESTVHQVIELRQTHGWCGEAIASHLQRSGVQVCNGSVYKILKKNGLTVRTYAPRRQRTYIRWQRSHPDSLWQTDIKYYGDRYVVAFLDDCSRYVPEAALLHNATTDRILHLLEKALNHGRAPHQILSDHGTQFYSDDGPSQFTKFCETHGIEHIMSSIGKPTTQGKIERFFRTFKAYYPRFNDIPEFLHHYNRVKPHRSLNFLTPAEVYFQ